MSKLEKGKRNHLVWVGAVVSVVGLLSYFFYFARFPALRDSAWLNFLLVGLGLVLSAMAIRRQRSVLSVRSPNPKSARYPRRTWL